MEEMGIECSLQELFCFTYRAELEGGLIEHEFDHVLVGQCHCQPQPNPEEVADWRWIAMDELAQDLDAHPERYTCWLRVCFDQFQKQYRYNAYTVPL
jgi:isopentenyl-diphosphate delta-isomerase